MLKRTLSLALFLVFIQTISLYSNTHLLVEKKNCTLSGVVQLADGTPVELVSVVLPDDNISVLTDDKGTFFFTDLKQGMHRVIVQSVELKQKTFHVKIENRKETTCLVVERSDIMLDQVTVVGKSKKSAIETQGFSVSVIEPKKMSLQSIQTNELLDRTAGVRIRQDGGLGSHINYNINGLSGNAVRIFIDGVPSSNFGSSFSLNSIPASLIERIEVYKGVVPGYLSEDALGGAINIILKNTTGGSLLASYSSGSFNTHQANVSGNYRNKKGFTLDASAYYNYSDNNYEVWGPEISFKDYMGGVYANQKARRFHDAYQSYGTRINAGVTKMKWADRLMLGTVLSEGYKEVQHGQTMDIVYGDRHNRRHSAVLTLNYDKKDFLTRGLSVKIDASHSRLARQTIDTVGVMYDWSGKPIAYPDGSPVRYSGGAEVGSQKTAAINRDHTYVMRANVSYRIAKGNTLFANYLFNDFVRGTTDEYEDPALQRLKNTRDLRKNILSFTYENLSFGDRLRTNLFYKHYFQRIISNEPFGTNVNGTMHYDVEKIHKKVDFGGYGLTLSYALQRNIQLLFSAERAIRLPNANEMFGNIAENLLPPKQDLKPETSNNANLGVNLGPFLLDEHSVKLNTTIFLRDTRGMIRQSVQSGNFVYTQYENLENVLSRGVDAELMYSYDDKLNFTFNISKFDVLFNTEFDVNGARYQFYRMQIRNEPSFKFSSNLSYLWEDVLQKNSSMTFFGNINYVNKFRRNWANIGGANLAFIPTQYPVDFGLAYTFPGNKVVLGFDAKNVFNQQVYDNFGLQKPGRAFFGKITWNVF